MSEAAVWWVETPVPLGHGRRTEHGRMFAVPPTGPLLLAAHTQLATTDHPDRTSPHFIILIHVPSIFVSVSTRMMHFGLCVEAALIFARNK